MRVAAQQQRRREEGAVRPRPRRPARSRSPAPKTTSLPRVEHLRPARPRPAAAPARRARPSARPRPTGRRRRRLRQPLAQLRGDRVEVLARHDRAPDRGALLPGLHRHLARHLLDEQVELLVVGRARRAPRIAQLSESASALNGIDFAQQVAVAAQLERGVGRAGEGDDVLAVEPVEQVAGRADHELQAALRQQARLDHHPHHRLGQVAGRGGRLGDAGHAGEEGRREFLEQAPDREVEGVDVHRDAAARHQDVGAGEAGPSCRAASPGLRGRRCPTAARCRPSRRRRRACRCRLRCRPSCRCASRRCGARSRRALPCARSGRRRAPSGAPRAAGSPSPSAPARRCRGRRLSASPKSISSAWVWWIALPSMALASGAPARAADPAIGDQALQDREVGHGPRVCVRAFRAGTSRCRSRS